MHVNYTVNGGFLDVKQRGNMRTFKALILKRCLLFLRERTIQKQKPEGTLNDIIEAVLPLILS